MDFGIPYFQANASIVIESRNYAWLMMIGYSAQYIGDCSENPLWGPHEATIRMNFRMAFDTAHMDPKSRSPSSNWKICAFQIHVKPPDRAGFVAFKKAIFCQVDNTSTGDVLWFHGRLFWAWPKKPGIPPAVFMGKLMINRWIFGNPWQPYFPTNPCRWKLTLLLRFGTLGPPEIFVL